MRKKITTIGGGTGQYTLLRGLKNYDIDLTAVVSMVDNGGNTGKLRDEFGVLPPGDLRMCLVALSEESEVLRRLFEHRFKNDCVGNIIIAASQKIVGKENYIQEVAKILNTKGQVLPITVKETNIYAETSAGRTLEGQLNVSYNVGKNEKIKKIWLKPKVAIFKKAREALLNSNLIVICPGDLYGSILPNFLIKGVVEAIKKSKAKIVYVCNLVNKQGTYGFGAKNFVKEIEKYLKRKIDVVILNKKKPTKKIVDKYKGEHSAFIQPNIRNSGKKVIRANLLLEHKTNGKIIARHDPKETAKVIMKLI